MVLKNIIKITVENNDGKNHSIDNPIALSMFFMLPVTIDNKAYETSKLK